MGRGCGNVALSRGRQHPCTCPLPLAPASLPASFFALNSFHGGETHVQLRRAAAAVRRAATAYGGTAAVRRAAYDGPACYGPACYDGWRDGACHHRGSNTLQLRVSEAAQGTWYHIYLKLLYSHVPSQLLQTVQWRVLLALRPLLYGFLLQPVFVVEHHGDVANGKTQIQHLEIDLKHSASRG